MEYNFFVSNFFHRFSAHDDFTNTPLDPATWPEEWKRIYFKAYPRLPRLELMPFLGTLPDVSIGRTLSGRASCRDFDNVPLAISEISNLLYYSAGIKHLPAHIESGDWDRSRRFYASGGARYPLELYPLILRRSADMNPGLYHYSVKTHSLETLWAEDDAIDGRVLDGAVVYSWARNAAMIIFVTAIFWRMQMKYGERGYRLILQESGHLGQNIYLVSEALGLGCCALDGFSDEAINRLLDIDGVNEAAIYAFAIGKKVDNPQLKYLAG